MDFAGYAGRVLGKLPTLSADFAAKSSVISSKLALPAGHFAVTAGL